MIHRRVHFPMLCILTAGLALIAAGCTLYGGGGGNDNTRPGPNEVFMRNIAFVPEEITVTAGTTVTWRNRDTQTNDHTVTSGNPGDNDAGSIFDSDDLEFGDTFTFTFDEPGEYIYFCRDHPDQMFGAKVIVEPAGG